jgi:hypothetical protein
MDTEPLPTNAALLARLRFIDFVLAHFGAINRRHLIDFFGVSQPQASLDLQRYLDLAPANMEYDLTGRTYRRSAGYTRLLP